MRSLFFGLIISIILSLPAPKARAQGQSVKKIDAPSKKAWSIDTRLSVKKGLKDDAESIFVQELVFEYDFPAKWSFGIAEVYQTPFSVFEDERTNWGLEDTEVFISKSVGDFSFTATNIFPTSQTSRDASLRLGMAGEGAYSLAYGRLSLRLALELIAYMYDYETADQDGTQYNSPWAQFWKASLGFKLVKGLSWFGTADHYAARNYAGTHDGVTRVITGFRYSFIESVTAQFYYRSQSAVLVNNSFYDDLESSYLFGLIFKI